VPWSGTIRRGDVVRVRLEPVVGSEQGGERPGLVISPSLINDRAPVILVAAITSRHTDRVYPFEALIEPPDGGLSRRSKVMLLQMRVVDKSRLVTRYGAVSDETMVRVDAALRIAVGLDLR
jgi:mRNA interferase MazF